MPCVLHAVSSTAAASHVVELVSGPPVHCREHPPARGLIAMAPMPPSTSVWVSTVLVYFATMLSAALFHAVWNMGRVAASLTKFCAILLAAIGTVGVQQVLPSLVGPGSKEDYDMHMVAHIMATLYAVVFVAVVAKYCSLRRAWPTVLVASGLLALPFAVPKRAREWRLGITFTTAFYFCKLVQVARAHVAEEELAALRSRPGKRRPLHNGDGDVAKGEASDFILFAAGPFGWWAHTVATFHDLRHMRWAKGGRSFDFAALGDVVFSVGCCCTAVAVMKARPGPPTYRPGGGTELVGGSLVGNRDGTGLFWVDLPPLYASLPWPAVWVLRRLAAAAVMCFSLGAFGRLWALLARALAGLEAPPLMDAPWKARSLREFWARRWNTTIQPVVAILILQRTCVSIETPCFSAATGWLFIPAYCALLPLRVP